MKKMTAEKVRQCVAINLKKCVVLAYASKIMVNSHCCRKEKQKCLCVVQGKEYENIQQINKKITTRKESTKRYGGGKQSMNELIHRKSMKHNTS